jgi:ParB family chromosome partitioning protein
MAAKKNRLGTGLDALLTAKKPLAEAEQVSIDDPKPVSGRQIKQIPLEQINRSPYQPRREFDPEALEELAASISARGLMQPIVVRNTPKGYELIAGERRWRASQQLQLETISAVVHDVSDEAAIAMALIENIQREDLNAMEQAIALDRLKTTYELTHAEVAEAVGKKRATVTNLLRLLALEPSVQTLLERGDLDMGHARALLSLEGRGQIEAAEMIISKRLSVRQTEQLVRKLLEPSEKPKKIVQDPDVRALVESLSERIGVPVDIKQGKGGRGKLVLTYTNLDELDGILSRIR